MFTIKSRKGLSPLITTILLIVVTFALIGIILGWGKNFTNNTKTTLDSFSESYTKDSTTVIKPIKFYPNNRLVINDILSKDNLTIIGYRILSDINMPGLNTIVNLSQPLVLSTGDSGSIMISRPPEKKFDIQLLTKDNKYVTVSDIVNHPIASITPVINTPISGHAYSLNQNILFSQTTTGGDGSYSCEWKADNNIISTSCDDFNYSFSTGGTITISLKVIDFENNTKTVSKNIVLQDFVHAVINSPTANSIHAYGDLINFSSNYLNNSGLYSCSWDSNIDGSFGNDCDLNYFGLSVGDHNITLSVTGPLNTDSDSVPIIVKNHLIPSITNPSDNSKFTMGDTINFIGNATNANGSYTCSWDSNIDGNLGTGCNINVSDLNFGNHLITLKVTDSSETQTKTIVVSVGCSTGYVLVPGNNLYNTSDFCVSKYEMKMDANGDGVGDNVIDYPDCNTGNLTYNTWNYSTCSTSNSVVSTKEGSPIAKISQTDAISACQAIGEHLITNNEWMTIVRNIEQVSSNWSSGVIGQGYIYSGHNNNSPAGALEASTDNDSYYGTGQTSGNQRRTLTLTNGEVIWDLAGNVYEWLDNTIQRKDEPDGFNNSDDSANTDGWNLFDYSKASGGSRYLNSTDLGNTTLTYKDLFLATSGNYNATDNGVGRIYTYSNSSDSYTGVYTFLRGGDWGGNSDAGVLNLFLVFKSYSSTSSIGFRCVK